MKKVFKDLEVYIRLHDGYSKPKINFQNMYKLFPDFEFLPSANFGEYREFGKAFEQKVYDMIVTDTRSKNSCYLKYREYGDRNENTAYVSEM